MNILWFLIADDSNQTKSWLDSSLTCQQKGGHLKNQGTGWSNVKAWLYTEGIWPELILLEGVNNELRYMMNNCIYFFTGGNVVNLRYHNWSQGQPDFSQGLCVMMSPNGNWSSAKCSEELPALCDTSESKLMRTNVLKVIEK